MPTSRVSCASGTNRAAALARVARSCAARFSIADCFYGPVAFRFQTYGVRVDGVSRAYLETLLAHPFMQEWQRAALAETTIIDADEPRLLYRDKIAAADGRSQSS